MNIAIKFGSIALALTALYSPLSYAYQTNQNQGPAPAAPVVINNNNSQPQAYAQQPACPPANQNNIYDPRVPPAGAYYTKNADGSGMQTFTTGEKKPYIVDNNCNAGVAAAQPQVLVNAPPLRH